MLSLVTASVLGCELHGSGASGGPCVRLGTDFAFLFDLAYGLMIVMAMGVGPLMFLVALGLLIFWVAIPMALRSRQGDGQRAAAMGESGVAYAGFWRRLFAFLIDLSPAVCLGLLAYYFEYRGDAYKAEAEMFLGTGIMFMWIPGIIWVLWRYSPGKRLLSLEIADSVALESPGRLILATQYFSGLLLGIIYGIGPLWMLFNKRKQGLHDLLAGTVMLHDTRAPERRGLLAALLVFVCLVYGAFIAVQIAEDRDMEAFRQSNLSRNNSCPQAETPIAKESKTADKYIPSTTPDPYLQAKAVHETAEARSREGMQAVNMAAIPAGEFLMGSLEEPSPNIYLNGQLTRIGKSEETPRHKVYLDKYYLSKYEVTAAQYREFANATNRQMREQPDWSTENHPVVNVNWEDASAYCKWAGGRLPTEAEWEKAARDAITQAYSFAYGFGNDAAKLGEYAWYDINSNGQAHPVGEKKPNKYGLHDMHGNVWEWVWDWYDGDYYPSSPSKNPKGPDSGDFRCIRGGAWHRDSNYLRSAFRGKTFPVDVEDHIGFRCASAHVKTVLIEMSAIETETPASDETQRGDSFPGM